MMMTIRTPRLRLMELLSRPPLRRVPITSTAMSTVTSTTTKRAPMVRRMKILWRKETARRSTLS